MSSPQSIVRSMLEASVEEGNRAARSLPGCDECSLASANTEPSAPFTAEHGAVTWNTTRGPVRLNDSQCEQLLDIWEQAEGYAARRLFLDLYEAHMRNGGIPR